MTDLFLIETEKNTYVCRIFDIEFTLVKYTSDQNNVIE